MMLLQFGNEDQAYVLFRSLSWQPPPFIRGEGLDGQFLPQISKWMLRRKEELKLLLILPPEPLEEEEATWHRVKRKENVWFLTMIIAYLCFLP